MLGATTSSAVETAERVRQACTEARFAVLGGGGGGGRDGGGEGMNWWCRYVES